MKKSLAINLALFGLGVLLSACGSPGNATTPEPTPSILASLDPSVSSRQSPNYEKIKVNYEEFKNWYSKPGELTLDHPLSSFEHKKSPKFIKSQRNIAERFFSANGLQINIDANGHELTLSEEYLAKDPRAFIELKTSELRIVYQLAMDASDPRNFEIAKMLIPYLTKKDSEARTQLTADMRVIEQGGKEGILYYTFNPSEKYTLTNARVSSQTDVGAKVANFDAYDQYNQEEHLSMKWQGSYSGLYQLAYIR